MSHISAGLHMSNTALHYTQLSVPNPDSVKYLPTSGRGLEQLKRTFLTSTLTSPQPVVKNMDSIPPLR